MRFFFFGQGTIAAFAPPPGAGHSAHDGSLAHPDAHSTADPPLSNPRYAAWIDACEEANKKDADDFAAVAVDDER